MDPEQYDRLASLDDLKDVGRAVGRLNKLLPKRQFILMGPGRWGSRGDIKLGVNVTYSDINNTAVLIEIAAKRGNYVPDLSFGTHFFQDLVEAGIRYVPLFPGDRRRRLQRAVPAARQRTSSRTCCPSTQHLKDVVRVIDVSRVTEGQILQVLMNADLDEAVAFFTSPSHPQPGVAERKTEPANLTEEHWRWRLRMAEHMAAELDAERFGIKALYIFGSTKNATAGPGSDIDLIVHLAGDDHSCPELQAWMEGWSLCLSQMNYLRTGYRTEGLLDVKYVTDADFGIHSSFASKIGAITDPARPLKTKVAVES